MNESELFAAAAGFSDDAARAAFLDRQCEGRPELRRRLEHLLDAYFRLCATTDSGGGGAPGSPTNFALNLDEGALIAGRYKLLQMIGEGGMGTVWMAEQTNPVKRRVAVKLIRTDRGQSKTILARFEAERQAIALMDHPNIAKLLDAGTTDAGTPFFVMDLVKGTPLTEYCDDHRLTVSDRLSLFVQVCHAIQHAHQKGIIHRDLKPSNILVESHEGRPVPKVIDFGLAKATSGLQLTENTLFTAIGSVVGTPLYMAPEQAANNALDVDTRADVYALGIILYELLTGTTPLTRETLRSAAMDEMLRLIREVDAPSPSSRLSSSDSAPTVAANRQTEPAKLGRLVKGELDWIVLKALSKDRDRRYESATGFAQDVERFLNQEPVVAGPPSAAYRVKKFVRRHRGKVVAAGLLVFMLLVGVIGTSYGLVEANHQKDLAQKAADKEHDANLLTEARLKQIEAINRAVMNIFTELDVRRARADGVPVESALAKHLVEAGRKLDANAIQDPVMLGNIKDRLGHTLVSLGRPADALPFLIAALDLRRATLGPDHEHTMTSEGNVASTYAELGRYELSLPMAEDLYRRTLAKFGAKHKDAMRTRNNLANDFLHTGDYAKAIPLFEANLQAAKEALGPEQPDTLLYMDNLSTAYDEAGRIDDALSISAEVLRIRTKTLGADHPETLTTRQHRASQLWSSGRREEAATLAEETLRLRKAKLGVDHPLTLRSALSVAEFNRALGRPAESLALFEESHRALKLVLGADHPNALAATVGAAECLLDMGRANDALPLLTDCHRRHVATLGVDHPLTLKCLHYLAKSHKDVRQFDKALALQEEELRLRTAKFGADHPQTLMAMNHLALYNLAASKYDKALELHQAVLRRVTSVRGGSADLTEMDCLNNVAHCLSKLGRRDEAIQLYERALSLSNERRGPDHLDTLNILSNLAKVYSDAKQHERAIPLLREAARRQTAKRGPAHLDTLHSTNNLGMSLKDAGQLDQATPIVEETLRLCRKHLGPEHPFTHTVTYNLATCYRDAGKLDQWVQLVNEYVAWERKRSPPDDLDFAAFSVVVAGEMNKQGRSRDAEPLLRESLAIRRKKIPEHWRTFTAASYLGESLLNQKKYAEAEPLLLEGFNGLKARQKAVIADRASIRLVEAADRLIAYYTATNRPKDVERWKAERAKYAASPAASK